MKATIYHPSKHLTKNEISLVGNHCPICQSKAKRSSFVNIQYNPDIALETCDNCKGSFANALPLSSVLDIYYENYYENNTESITFHDSIKFAKHILKPMNFSQRQVVTILDFGGGGGDISKAVAEQLINKFPNIKIEITVVDYEVSKDMVNGSIIFRNKKKLIDIKGESYDLVIASAVLEHILDIYNVITTLFSMINNDGYFYARTPYMEPIMRLSEKIDMTYPAHIYDLGGEYWNSVIQTYNLNAIKLHSRPSIVETSFSQSFIRALVAYILKIPGYIEVKLFPKKKKIYWKWVGGWEIYLKFSSKQIKKNNQ